MTDLSPELEQLVLAGKSAGRPADADSARVFEALQARLGTAVGVDGGEAPATMTGNAARVLASKTAGTAVAGLALVIGAIAVLTILNRGTTAKSAGPSFNAVVRASTQAASIPCAAPPQFDARAPTPAPLAPLPSQTKTLPVAAPSRRAHDSLSEEVRILARAETELHSGRAENALKLLDEHEHRFTAGILAEERTAARIQALCAIGRTADANDQLARLSPESLHGEQARQACGSSKRDASRQTAGRQSTGSRLNRP